MGRRESGVSPRGLCKKAGEKRHSARIVICASGEAHFDAPTSQSVKDGSDNDASLERTGVGAGSWRNSARLTGGSEQPITSGATTGQQRFRRPATGRARLLRSRLRWPPGLREGSEYRHSRYDIRDHVQSTGEPNPRLGDI